MDEPVEELRDRRQHGQAKRDGTDHHHIVHRHAPTTAGPADRVRANTAPAAAGRQPSPSASGLQPARTSRFSSVKRVSSIRTKDGQRRGNEQMGKRSKRTKTKKPQRGGPGPRSSPRAVASRARPPPRTSSGAEPRSRKRTTRNSRPISPRRRRPTRAGPRPERCRRPPKKPRHQPAHHAERRGGHRRRRRGRSARIQGAGRRLGLGPWRAPRRRHYTEAQRQNVVREVVDSRADVSGQSLGNWVALLPTKLGGGTYAIDLNSNRVLASIWYWNYGDYSPISASSLRLSRAPTLSWLRIRQQHPGWPELADLRHADARYCETARRAPTSIACASTARRCS